MSEVIVKRRPGHTAQDDVVMARRLREILKEFHERDAAGKAAGASGERENA